MASAQARALEAGDGLNQSTAIAVGAGVGGFVIVVAVIILLRIHIKRKHFNRAVLEIEHGLEHSHDRPLDVVGIPRPASVGRRLSAFKPFAASSGWNALSSKEAVHDIPLEESAGVRNIPSASLNALTSKEMPFSKRLRRAVSLGRHRRKYLSTIKESPQSIFKSPKPADLVISTSPSMHGDLAHGTHPLSDRMVDWTNHHTVEARTWPQNAAKRSIISVPKEEQADDDADDITQPGGVERPKIIRSQSMGTFLGPVPVNAIFEDIARPTHAALHTRSRSIDANAAGPAPTVPLPPLPSERLAFTRPGNELQEQVQIPTGQALSGPQSQSTHDRCGGTQNEDVCVSRASPAYVRRNSTRAQSCRRSSMVRFSSTSCNSHRTSTSSGISSLADDSHQLSVPQLQTAGRISISRVSSCGSLQSDHSMRIVSTPRRRVGSRVSFTGSPAERKKTSILQDASGNLMTPQLTPNTTRDSSCSGISNPFQWDTMMQPSKPSALKGSPGARKGHKRQNRVRISTLAPTILGPCSRSNSPSLDGIAEESPDMDDEDVAHPRDIVFDRPDMRPTTRPTLEAYDRLDPTKLRASLTPSSPTLSLSNFYQGYERRSRPSSLTTYRQDDKDDSALSREASLLSIPSFPSPMDPREMHDFVAPTIDVTRPSTELDVSSDPPFAFTPSPDLKTAANAEYDPCWLDLSTGLPTGTSSYDPANPILAYPTPDRSSAMALTFSDDFDGDGCSDPIGVSCHPTQTRSSVSPPCSPIAKPTYMDSSPPEMMLVEIGADETTPTAFPMQPPSSGDRKDLDRALQSPLSVHPLDHIPVLLPPNPLKSQAKPETLDFAPTPVQPTLAPPQPHSLQGPRTQPAFDVRKSVMALRRMNSSLDPAPPDLVSTTTTGVQRYLKLGREASPLLPFTGNFGNVQETEDQDPDGLDEDGGFDFGFKTADVDALLDTTAESWGSFQGANADRRDVEGMNKRRDDNTRMPTVWADGEGFWSDKENQSQWKGNPTTQHGSGKGAHAGGWNSNETTAPSRSGTTLLSTPTPKFKIFDVDNVVRTSPTAAVAATPKSLYDADGFLKA